LGDVRTANKLIKTAAAYASAPAVHPHYKNGTGKGDAAAMALIEFV